MGDPKEWDMEGLGNGMWEPLRNGIWRGPQGMGYPSYLLPVICCLRASSLADTGAAIGCKCFPGVALPLIVSWQFNGNSRLAFGSGASFPSPGPHFSRSRTFRAEPDGLFCLLVLWRCFPVP